MGPWKGAFRPPFAHHRRREVCSNDALCASVAFFRTPATATRQSFCSNCEQTFLKSGFYLAVGFPVFLRFAVLYNPPSTHSGPPQEFSRDTIPLTSLVHLHRRRSLGTSRSSQPARARRVGACFRFAHLRVHLPGPLPGHSRCRRPLAPVDPYSRAPRRFIRLHPPTWPSSEK